MFLSALARALDGRDFPYLGQSPLKVPLVYASAALPVGMRRRVYAMATGKEGVPPDRLGEVDLEGVADWAARTYPERRYPAVLVGSSNGALTHLAAACGAPWLPQTLLVPVRRLGADQRDARGALDFGIRHAARLLDPNPGVELHHMHDANQDALSASAMAYFRVKWRVLPRAYERFLRQRLEPGAPVIVVRDQSSWPVTRVAERHVFQLGALGGMSPHEYLAAPGAHLRTTPRRRPSGASPRRCSTSSAAGPSATVTRSSKCATTTRRIPRPGWPTSSAAGCGSEARPGSGCW